MNRKSFVLLIMLLALACQATFADGWTFTNGRFPQGKVTVFKLTEAQKAFLDLVRRCQTDNTRTPYLFTLTREQSAVLRREVGFSPDRFAIFESYRGDKGVDLEVNVINRFSEDEFEVPRVAQSWRCSNSGSMPHLRSWCLVVIAIDKMVHFVDRERRGKIGMIGPVKRRGDSFKHLVPAVGRSLGNNLHVKILGGSSPTRSLSETE